MTPAAFDLTEDQLSIRSAVDDGMKRFDLGHWRQVDKAG